MSDEIKEILRNCEKAINEVSGYNDTTDKILDYITNLRTIEQQYSALLSENAELQEELKGYKQERENLFKTTHDLQKEIKRLKEENKRIFSKVNDDELLISNAMNYAEAQDYKSRCEKAIEYVNNHQLVFELSSKKQIQYWFDMFYKDLLNILKGDKDV